MSKLNETIQSCEESYQHEKEEGLNESIEVKELEKLKVFLILKNNRL